MIKRHFFLFLLKALLWGVVTFLLAKGFTGNRFWFVVISVLLLSIPISLCGIYSNTIAQIRRLNIFSEKGWIYRLLSRRPLKALLWIFWALGTSFFMLVQFQTYSYLEWFIFFLVAPVFWFVFTLNYRIIAREIKPYLVTNMALIWARRLCPLLMLIIYLVFLGQFTKTTQYSSIHEAIEAQKIVVADLAGSAVVYEVSQYLAFFEGLKRYVLGHSGTQGTFWALLLFGIFNLVVFYNACAMLSCLLISRVEYRRIFLPLTDENTPSPLSRLRISAFVAAFTFFTLFIYVSLFVGIEAHFKQTPEIIQTRKNAETWAIPKFEKIDDIFFKEGTLSKIHRARVAALHNFEASLASPEKEADRAFDLLEANVDIYLDWYYSLTGEYLRIVNLLVGELENYMIEKLESVLQHGDPFKDFQAALNSALNEHEEAQRIYHQAVNEIMQENRVDYLASSFQIVATVSLKDVLNPPIHEDLIGLEQRLAAGGGGAMTAGIVSTVVIKKIVAKIASKNVFNLAAKSLIKVVAAKGPGAVSSVAVGSVIGGAAGSLIPFVGTATGAFIGGAVAGIVIGVAVDKMLIELEAVFSRENFKNEILSAIGEARMEFKAKLRS